MPRLHSYMICPQALQVPICLSLFCVPNVGDRVSGSVRLTSVVNAGGVWSHVSESGMWGVLVSSASLLSIILDLTEILACPFPADFAGTAGGPHGQARLSFFFVLVDRLVRRVF